MLYYSDKCTHCGKCEKICENHQKECTLCGKCVFHCPNDAKEICGKEYTVDEVYKEIIKDKHYYDSSNGGVTFSGGECMLQIDFLTEILKKCKQEEINTAVDTAGNVPYEYFKKIIPYTDTFLYDIKCVTSDLHKQFTSVSNELIISNLENLSKNFKGKIIVRIPLIGGFNDTDYEILKIKELLSSFKITNIEVLPYHNLGLHKYQALNMKTIEFYTPNENEITKYTNILKS